MEINVLGLCICSREFVRQLKERGVDDGHIILVNSLSGHRVPKGGPFHFYCATKHAVTAITAGLRQELRDEKSHIKVTSISPGLVRTEFRGRADNVKDLEQSKKEYDKICAEVLEAEDIASAILYTLSTPPRMQIHDILVRSINQIG